MAEPQTTPNQKDIYPTTDTTLINVSKEISKETTKENEFKLIESYSVVKMKGVIEYFKDNSEYMWVSTLFEELLKKNPETDQLLDAISIINIPFLYNETDFKCEGSILKSVPANIRNYLCDSKYYYIYIPKANGLIFIENGFTKYLINALELEKTEQSSGYSYRYLGTDMSLKNKLSGIKNSIKSVFSEQELILKYFTRKRINKEEFILEFQKKFDNPKDLRIIKELFNYHSEFYSNTLIELRNSLNVFSFSTVSEIFQTLNNGLVRQIVNTLMHRGVTLTCIMDDGVIIPRFKNIQILLEVIELLEYKISSEYHFDIELKIDFMRQTQQLS